MADSRDRSSSSSPSHSGVTRRDFLDRSGRIALGLGAIQLGLGRHALAEGLGLLSVPPVPLASRAAVSADDFTLGNPSITASWTTAGGAFRPVRLADVLNSATLPVSAQAFTLTFADKSTLQASDMRITSQPRAEALAANAGASRLAERVAGNQVTITLQDRAGSILA